MAILMCVCACIFISYGIYVGSYLIECCVRRWGGHHQSIPRFVCETESAAGPLCYSSIASLFANTHTAMDSQLKAPTRACD